ncbi:cAMP-regulated phosphoprotein 19 [Eumeta japonica]|uniref:cAMP-regulated phosphoprotein 19 n=1 Tax=Eumeta variegata TaxID=151549 RepID=A0A4C1WUW5_EUMVA|nr:cAMP-regulated phosphoprotein 19 [Eumeta japonica]
MSDSPDQNEPPKDPRELEKLEEAKLKAKFPNAVLGRGPGGPGGHSAFLQKRLAKGQKFFDSGDYQMAKQRPGSLAAPFKAAAPKLPTDSQAHIIEWLSETDKEGILDDFSNSNNKQDVVDEQNRVMILISTMHDDATIDGDTGDEQNPEMITYYNHMNNNADLVDKMCSLYDVYYNLLNISTFNAICMYVANKNYVTVRHGDFRIGLSLS